MPSPSSQALQNLYNLDTSSPDFGDQLSTLLYGEEYMKCLPDLEDDDVFWLVNFLDRVRLCILCPPRSLLINIPNLGSR